MIAIVISHPSTLTLRSFSIKPALFQRTSKVFVCALTCSASDLTSAIEETSPVTSEKSAFGAACFNSAKTGFPRASERAWTKTFHPRRPNSSAPALPIPVDAPVINIVLLIVTSFCVVVCAGYGLYVRRLSFPVV
ncbi:MAG: hypothetical protein IPL71_18380 [Anaerolineales bacterium]|uniref:hypothetical protein n=1 Tax=Candidatus Villigracilis proximus TaxID=3140683 RepID=UPI00313599F3|nr:hypothetical protein [Anaerolineales bacterium]